MIKRHRDVFVYPIPVECSPRARIEEVRLRLRGGAGEASGSYLAPAKEPDNNKKTWPNLLCFEIRVAFS